ncbi:hypothetical protein D3C71_1757380 [compost metagenome]
MKIPVVHTREQFAAAWQYALPTGKPFLVSAALLRGQSAILAKARLHQIIKADRESYRDGKWVEKCHGGLYEIWVGHDMVGYELKKPRYRWERRR